MKKNEELESQIEVFDYCCLKPCQCYIKFNKKEEFETQIKVCDNDCVKCIQSKNLLVEAIRRVAKLRQIRIQESKILEEKNSIWDSIWLYNSLYLIIFSILEIIMSKLDSNSNFSFDIINVYLICLTIIILVMTYFVKTFNLEKNVAIKHHEQSSYRNLITEAVLKKTKYKLCNNVIYKDFINKRNMITQFSPNHKTLAYLLTNWKEEEQKSVDLKNKIKRATKEEYKNIFYFITFLFLFNLVFTVFEIFKNIMINNWNKFNWIIFISFLSFLVFSIILNIFQWLSIKNRVRKI